MITAQVLVSNRKAGSVERLEKAGVLPLLREALAKMNPDWSAYKTETVVLWSARFAAGSMVVMSADCDPAPGVLEQMVTLELEP